MCKIDGKWYGVTCIYNTTDRQRKGVMCITVCIILLGSRNVWNTASVCKFKLEQHVKRNIAQIVNVNKWNHSLLAGNNGMHLYGSAVSVYYFCLKMFITFKRWKQWYNF